MAVDPPIQMLRRRWFVNISVLVILFFPGGYPGHQYGIGNITNILQQYVLVCGMDSICNQDLIQFTFQPTFKKQHEHVCPPCDCSDHCGTLGNCCPDKILNGPNYKCVNTTLVLNRYSKGPEIYQMVTDCPSVNARLHTKCFSEDDSGRDEHNKPVTSSNGITYRNQFCAICNNETDFTQWSLSITCQNKEDMSGFNYVSSMKEIINLGMNKSCDLQYIPSGMNRTCQSKEDIVIKECNVTGKWKEFDPDIDWACQNYDTGPTYKLFKNIFCYICNPTLEGSSVIKECNNTLAWHDYDGQLLRACNELPAHYRTYPYKNVFCYYCNRGKNSLTDIDTHAVDKLGSESVIYLSSEQFSVEIKYTKQNSKSNFSGEWENHIRQDGEPVNVSNILYNHMLFEGSGLCNTRYIPFLVNHTVPNICRCDTTCITQQSCCIDFTLTAHNYCSSDQILTDGEYRKDEVLYAIINDCPDHSSRDLKNMCEVGNDNDMMTKITVISNKTNLLYKNIYCGMCHEAAVFVESNGDISTLSPVKIPSGRIQFMPSHIIIACTPFTDFTYITDLKSILYFSKYNGCVIKTMSGINSEPSRCSHDEDSLTGHCNATGTWFNYDPDIEWGCENSSFPYIHAKDNFRNIFCEMCNPTPLDSEIIDRCNTTGGQHKPNRAVSDACEHYPLHYASQPYKNSFCRRCNMAIPTKNIPPSPPNRSIVPVPYPVYRWIFAFSHSEKNSKTDVLKQSQMCNEDEMYDTYQDKCLEISCSPGKILENHACVPFLTKGSYLRYNLFFAMKANLTGTATNLNDVLRHLQIEMNVTLSENVMSPIQYVSYFLATNLSCEGLTFDNINRTEVKVLYYAKFIIMSYVDRVATEKALMDIRYAVFNVTVNNILITFFGNPAIEAYDIFKTTRMCFKYFTSNTTVFGGRVTMFEVVSEIMSCKQVQIAKGYELFPKTGQVHIPFLNKTFEVDQYRLGDNNSINVCVDDYSVPDVHQVLGIRSEMDQVLGIFTMSCTCLSLVSLFISFITYALFPTLRTVPGKNNMCFIVALFSAQATFQFGVLQAQTEEICLALGILSHYLWLMTFCCMSVCCFHICLSFDMKFTTALDKIKSGYLLKRYCVFSFGTPMLIILLNSGITLAVSDGVDAGYGSRRCFITHLYAVVFTLALPLILSIATNIVCFCLTLKTIRSCSKIRSRKNKKRKCIVYLKFFSLTGITWILQIIDSNVEILAFSFLVTFLNGCQGVFIFVSFICNERVFSLYKSLCFAKGRSHT